MWHLSEVCFRVFSVKYSELPNKKACFVVPLLFLFCQHSFADVAALGRIEPKNGVLKITAPTNSETGFTTIVSELNVDPGETISKGQLLFVTESAALLQALLEESKTAHDLTLKDLGSAEADAKATCILADVKEREAVRRENLAQQNLSSVEEAESARADSRFQNASCTAAKVNIQSMHARAVVAMAEVTRREISLQRAQIKSPIDGIVLNINVWPGEMIGPEGVMDIADTTQMFAIAEVYETDVYHLRVEQKATISSKALPEDLSGQVTLIRPFVRKQDVTGTDPAARKDARIVEVEIAIDDSEQVESLSNLQVEVTIQN